MTTPLRKRGISWLGTTARSSWREQFLVRDNGRVALDDLPDDPRLVLGAEIGPYRLDRLMGAGDVGSTYDAHHATLGKGRVVLKLLHPRLATKPGVADAFASASAVLSSLRTEDRSLVPVLECSAGSSELIYAVREYVDGMNLREQFEQPSVNSDKRLLEEVGRQIAICLARAHAANVVHGNLHPSNIILTGLTQKPTKVQCRVVDFGLNQVAVLAGVKRSGEVREYLAPEVVRGLSAPTPAADVYSLGALLFRGYTETTPSSQISTMPPAIPGRLAPLLRAMLKENPLDRPLMKQVADELAPEVFGKFELGQVRSQDPRSVVYEAIQLDTGTRGRLRVFNAIHDGEPASHLAIAAAEALKRIDSPYVIEILDSGVQQGKDYVFLESIDGSLLSDLVRPPGIGARAYALGLQLSRALQSAHQRSILYLGLHPENILIVRDKKGAEQVKLLDTEAAIPKRLSRSEIRRTIEAMSIDRPTSLVLYMAPEQCDIGAIVDEPADVYALGTVLYFMISGLPPYSYQGLGVDQFITTMRKRELTVFPLRRRVPQAPQLAVDLVEQMLSIDPMKRPSLSEVEHLLNCLATGGAAQELKKIGEYRIGEMIGWGGMSVVMEAFAANKQPFALKVPLPGVLAERIEQESKVAQKLMTLSHPGLLQIHGIVPSEEGRTCLVMERLHGEMASDRIQRHGPLAEEAALIIGEQVAAALATAHANGIIHRDVKPSNIMLLEGARYHGTEAVKVIDFGIARTATDGQKEPQHRLTKVGVHLGTSAYMSPEQHKNASSVNTPTDVYSLGVSLFELLSGQLPPTGQLPVVASLDVMALLASMLQINPSHRPSMKSVAAEIRRILDGRVSIPWRRLIGITLSAGLLVGLTYWNWPVSWEIRTDIDNVDVMDTSTGKSLGTTGDTKAWKFKPEARWSTANQPIKLQLKRPGYMAREILLYPRSSTNQYQKFDEAYWTFKIAPEGAVVNVAGQPFMGPDAKKLKVLDAFPEGETRSMVLPVIIQKDGYVSQKLQLDTTQAALSQVQLVQAMIKITSTPIGASLSPDDGNIFGKTPYEIEYSKLPKTQHIFFDHPGYQRLKKVLPRRPHEDLSIDVALAPLESAEVDLRTQTMTLATVKFSATGVVIGQLPLKKEVTATSWPTEIEIEKNGCRIQHIKIERGAKLTLDIPCVKDQKDQVIIQPLPESPKKCMDPAGCLPG